MTLGKRIMKDHTYFVYIMTNPNNTVLYTGVTNDLKRRVYEHKSKIGGAFTKRYNVVKLVYYQMTESIDSAIFRERQIKGGSREKKIELINEFNPEWKDLYFDIYCHCLQGNLALRLLDCVGSPTVTSSQ
jgi:putative endonuclease